MLLAESTSVPSPPILVISHGTIPSHSQVFSSLKHIYGVHLICQHVHKRRATYWNLGSSSLKKTRLSLSMQLFITSSSSARGRALWPPFHGHVETFVYLTMFRSHTCNPATVRSCVMAFSVFLEYNFSAVASSSSWSYILYAPLFHGAPWAIEEQVCHRFWFWGGLNAPQ